MVNQEFPAFIEARQVGLARIFNQLLGLTVSTEASPHFTDVAPIEAELPDDDDEAFEADDALPGPTSRHHRVFTINGTLFTRPRPSPCSRNQVTNPQGHVGQTERAQVMCLKSYAGFPSALSSESRKSAIMQPRTTKLAR